MDIDNPINTTTICQIQGHPHAPDSVANAILIAEAGNVANETGLSPRELLEQRDELKDICSTVLALMALERMGRHDTSERMKTLLLKCTNKTK